MQQRQFSTQQLSFTAVRLYRLLCFIQRTFLCAINLKGINKGRQIIYNINKKVVDDIIADLTASKDWLQ